MIRRVVSFINNVSRVHSSATQIVEGRAQGVLAAKLNHYREIRNIQQDYQINKKILKANSNQFELERIQAYDDYVAKKINYEEFCDISQQIEKRQYQDRITKKSI